MWLIVADGTPRHVNNAIFLFYSLIGSAEVQTIKVKALYKSRDKENATIVYNKKKMIIPVDRIKDASHALVGSQVTVILYPSEIGLDMDTKE